MDTLYQIFGLLIAGFLAWSLYKNIQHNPEAFSKKNFSKSFTTIGMLAIGLIGFVYILTLMVKN
tara:strand:+ start:165 stop:356 length:192 start_codon:yes stop_codon:yes gene_type:complete